MTPQELRDAGHKLFGYGWQTRLATVLRVDPSTVRRWLLLHDPIPIPGPVVCLVRVFLWAHDSGRLPEVLRAAETARQEETA